MRVTFLSFYGKIKLPAQIFFVSYQRNYDNMKNILSRYDIDFCEIPRRKITGKLSSTQAVKPMTTIN